MHITDKTGFVPVHQLTYTITRRSLVAHLGNHFILVGSPGEHPCFINIMGQWFLHVHMFTQLHGCHGCDRMRMIRG